MDWVQIYTLFFIAVLLLLKGGMLSKDPTKSTIIAVIVTALIECPIYLRVFHII